MRKVQELLYLGSQLTY